MYQPSRKRPFGGRWLCVLILVTFLTSGLGLAVPGWAQQILQKLDGAQERIEMTVSTSRILTLEKKIPRAQVNNPDLLVLTPLSPNQIQISAEQPGVTQVNLWDEEGNVFSLDVIIYGDVKELELALEALFPTASVKVIRYSNSIVLTGFVDQPDNVSNIVRMAEDYAPKVVNNIKVGGMQQVVLHIKVMEVSRTKLRKVAHDFLNWNNTDFVASSISGLLASVSNNSIDETFSTTTSGGETFQFGIVDPNNTYFGVMEALRQYDLMKILAEPRLTTVSGRPASFNVGGEIPILVPQGLGSVSIEYKPFGTQVDVLPIVLGNGNIRLEVRPRVSEIDSTRSVKIDDLTVPGLRVREVDTGVELKAGQSLAIAGLIQDRVEAQNRGVPFLADLPWIGALFRRVEYTNNEIELLIMVRPEFAGALDPHETPQGGPGLDTTHPDDHDLYGRGHLEVPICCIDGSCSQCTASGESASYQEVLHSGDPSARTEPASGGKWTGWFGGRRSTSRDRTSGDTADKGNRGNRHPNGPAEVPRTSPYSAASRPRSNPGEPARPDDRPRFDTGMIGPIGYDVQK